MAYSQLTTERLGTLLEMLSGKSTMLIVIQDIPDPDAIAAAVALRELANRTAGVACSLVHGGTIGRAENRALVSYLKLRIRHPDHVDLDKFDLIAMVDTQPGTGNNCLPSDTLPDIVIDHHTIRPETRSVEFTDIRSKYGATSTILLEYLLAARVMPTKPIATALMYGIRSDTQDLGREARSADINAIEVLYPSANKRMLGHIQRGRVPDEYYQMLVDALKRATIFGDVVVSFLGEVENPDMMAELADLLLRHEECTWSLCCGFVNGCAVLSIRKSANRARADKVMAQVVSRIGTGGGHAAMAGGRIPIKDNTNQGRGKLIGTITSRFLKAVGADPEVHRKLIA